MIDGDDAPMYRDVEIITTTKSGEVTTNGSNASATEDQGRGGGTNYNRGNADYGVWFSNCSTINM